jgi:sortase A
MKLPERLNKFPVRSVIGIILLAGGLALLLSTYFPVFQEELKYNLTSRPKNISVVLPGESSPQDSMRIEPVDTSFGIVIPKIQANAKVIKDVDPDNSFEYQQKLTLGVAHARGSAYPGGGNTFIFAQSAGNFYDAGKYNAVFYLLNKLETDDPIYLFYQNRKIAYKVAEKKIVEASQVQYMDTNTNKSSLTLMTCWPPGTTFKRLIVVAIEID